MKTARFLLLFLGLPMLAQAHTEEITCRLSLAGKHHQITSGPGSRSLDFKDVLPFGTEFVRTEISIAETGRFKILIADDKIGNQLLVAQGNSDLFSGMPRDYIFAGAGDGVSRVQVSCKGPISQFLP